MHARMSFDNEYRGTDGTHYVTIRDTAGCWFCPTTCFVLELTLDDGQFITLLREDSEHTSGGSWARFVSNNARLQLDIWGVMKLFAIVRKFDGAKVTEIIELGPKCPRPHRAAASRAWAAIHEGGNTGARRRRREELVVKKKKAAKMAGE